MEEYEFEKITDSEISENDVEGNSNPLKGTVAENQGIFDKLPKFIARKVNDLIDFVNTINRVVKSHLTTNTNPHEVTKEQVGLSAVDNTADKDKPISTATQKALDDKVDKVEGKGLSTLDFDYLTLRYIEATRENLEQFKSDIETNLTAFRDNLSTLADNDNLLDENLLKHEKNSDNPHSVTKAQVGLSNVDNTADKDKPVSDATRAALNKINQKYREIYNYTLAEGGATYLEFYTDLKYQPFNLKDVVVFIYIPESFTLTKPWSIYANSNDSGYCMTYLNSGSASSGTGRYFMAKAEHLDGTRWWNTKFAKLSANSYNGSIVSSYDSFKCESINRIYINIQEAPVGTQIKVYGREVTE